MPGDTLKNGEWLLTGNSLFSKDGSVEFKMQVDGKIAVYWGSDCRFQNTANQRDDIKGVQLQDDGNLVMYDNSGQEVWSSGSGGKGDQYTWLLVQNDGNVVLYKPIWATDTYRG